MKRLMVLLIAVLLPVSSWAAKPEWAGNKGGKQAEKSQQRSENNHKEKQAERSIVSDTEEILDDLRDNFATACKRRPCYRAKPVLSLSVIALLMPCRFGATRRIALNMSISGGWVAMSR